MGPNFHQVNADGTIASSEPATCESSLGSGSGSGDGDEGDGGGKGGDKGKGKGGERR